MKPAVVVSLIGLGFLLLVAVVVVVFFALKH
jgi:Sec-independent protein translocase protein TatA